MFRTLRRGVSRVAFAVGFVARPSDGVPFSDAEFALAEILARADRVDLDDAGSVRQGLTDVAAIADRYFVTRDARRLRARYNPDRRRRRTKRGAG